MNRPTPHIRSVLSEKKNKNKIEMCTPERLSKRRTERILLAYFAIRFAPRVYSFFCQYCAHCSMLWLAHTHTHTPGYNRFTRFHMIESRLSSPSSDYILYRMAAKHTNRSSHRVNCVCGVPEHPYVAIQWHGHLSVFTLLLYGNKASTHDSNTLMCSKKETPTHSLA